MPSAVNYSKWDALAAELDDEDDAAAARAAAARGAQKAVPQPGSAEYKASVDHHKMSVALMADWTKAGADDDGPVSLRRVLDEHGSSRTQTFEREQLERVLSDLGCGALPGD